MREEKKRIELLYMRNEILISKRVAKGGRDGAKFSECVVWMVWSMCAHT